jgi:hypothetical protein
MATKLEKTIKRELDIDGTTYTIAISPAGLKVTEKGHRKGHEVSWRSIVGGHAELHDQLDASLAATGHGAASEEEDGGE